MSRNPSAPMGNEVTSPPPGFLDAERSLVRRASAGDAVAFADLVGLHRDRCWATCLRITGHRHDAEDALQDALTAAWQHLDTFRGEARFGTWLHRIAANAALKVVTRRRETPLSELPEASQSGIRQFDDAVVRTDAVTAALVLLPHDFRVALVLREYADLTYEEIAAAQGVGVQTVKSRLNRARRAMHTMLGTP